MAWRVVIAGGGFGGLYAARRLERLLPSQSAQVTLLSDVNFLLYTPLLPGAASGTLETISEAIALRNRALVNLEIAETIDDPEERRSWLTFVFVGAGYAGLEGIAELQDYIADVIERYPRSRIDGTRWILVEAGERIMPEIHPGLAEFAARELRGRGIDIRTSTTLDAVTADTATLSTGEVIPCRTLVWTAGVRPAPVVAKLGLPLDERGRIVTDEYLRVPGYEGVWAIGDSAAVPDPAANRTRPTPPTAQHALRQGRLAGANVAAALGHGKLGKFNYKTLGVFVDMGRHEAVAEMLRIRIRGFPAWFAARTYHLALMPGVMRRVRLVVDWTVALAFRRDSPELGQLGHPPSLDSE
jgi:NADH dehydrogenase